MAGAVGALVSAAGAAGAQEVLPEDGAIGMLTPATSIMREIEAFHGFLLPIIVAISAFVLVLLLWVVVRYNRRANPTPRKFTHNILVEVIWTIVPVLILVVIAWKSFPLIYREETIPPAELTLKRGIPGFGALNIPISACKWCRICCRRKKPRRKAGPGCWLWTMRFMCLSTQRSACS